MNRPVPRRRAIVAVALSLVPLLAACGVPGDDGPRSVPSDEIPQGLAPADAVDPKPPSRFDTVQVWFVREGALAPRSHRIVADGGASAALQELLEGPSDIERTTLSMRSAIPEASAVLGVTTTRGVAAVELAPTFAEIPASDQILAVAQIVLTLTDLRGVGRVRFTVEGVDVAVPLPSGESSIQAVSRDDFIVLTRSAG